MLEASDIKKMKARREKLEKLYEKVTARWYSLDDEICDCARQMEDIQGEIEEIDEAIGEWEEESGEVAELIPVLDGQTCMFSDMTLTPTQGE